MRIRTVVGFVLAVVAIGIGSGLLLRRVHQRPGELTPEQFESFLRSTKQKGLDKRIEAMRWMVGAGGRAQLKADVDALSTQGLGIEYTAYPRPDGIWAPRIIGVYRGSPAERAGIKPGDWLISVRGQNVYDSCVAREGDPCPSLGGSDSVHVLVAAAGKGPFELVVSRPDGPYVLTVQIGPLSETLASCARGRTAGYGEYLDRYRPLIEDLAEKTKSLTDEQLEEALVRADSLQDMVAFPWRELSICRDQNTLRMTEEQ